MILIVVINSSVSDSISHVSQNPPIRHCHKCRFFYPNRTSLHELTRVDIAITILGHEKDIVSACQGKDSISPIPPCCASCPNCHDNAGSGHGNPT